MTTSVARTALAFPTDAERPRTAAVTLARLAAICRAESAEVAIVDTATRMVREVAPLDYRGQLAAIVAWVRAHVRYVRDPVSVEYIRSPSLLVERAQTGDAAGDCDDLALLCATLARAIGFPVKFCALGYGTPGDASAHYSHVCAIARAGSLSLSPWLNLDTTPAGAIPPGRIARTLYQSV